MLECGPQRRRVCSLCFGLVWAQNSLCLRWDHQWTFFCPRSFLIHFWTLLNKIDVRISTCKETHLIKIVNEMFFDNGFGVNLFFRRSSTAGFDWHTSKSIVHVDFQTKLLLHAHEKGALQRGQSQFSWIVSPVFLGFFLLNPWSKNTFSMLAHFKCACFFFLLMTGCHPFVLFLAGSFWNSTFAWHWCLHWSAEWSQFCFWIQLSCTGVDFVSLTSEFLQPWHNWNNHESWHPHVMIFRSHANPPSEKMTMWKKWQYMIVGISKPTAAIRYFTGTGSGSEGNKTNHSIGTRDLLIFVFFHSISDQQFIPIINFTNY